MKNIYIIYFIFIFCGTKNYSQNYKQNYNDSVRVYFDKKHDFQKASDFALEGINYFEKINDTLNWKYAECLMFYYGIKNDSSYSKKPLKKVINIYKKAFGDESYEYLFTLKVISRFFEEQKMHNEAEFYYIELVNLSKKKYGAESIYYAQSLFFLGEFYFNRSNYKKAINNLLKSSNLQDNIFKGRDNERDVENYYLIELLGRTFENIYDYSKAGYFYLKVYKLNSKKNGESHISNSIYLNRLNNANSYTGALAQSNIYIKKNLSILKNNGLQNGIEYNLLEKAMLVNNLKINYVSINDTLNIDKQLNISYFENQLKIKNSELRNYQSLLHNLKNNSDYKLNNLYYLYVNNKKKIIKLKEEAFDKKDLNRMIDDLDNATDSLENKLNLKIKNDLVIKWDEIKDRLSDHEIVIDLLHLRQINNEVIYSAFLIGKNYDYPIYIRLFEEQELRRLLDKSSQDKDYLNNLYTNKFISELFFKKIDKKIKGITTIYLSTTGLGNQIDFAALSINDKQTLGEKYKLHILNSSAELLNYKAVTLEKKYIELLLYGGIDYDNSQEKSNLSLNNNLILLDYELNDLAKRSGFDKLPGTLTEVESITENAKGSGFSSKVIKESEATEESVKALDGRTEPYVLHLATHGFFFPDPIQELSNHIVGKSNLFKVSEDSMMRSGLLLAGAKKYWGKSNQNNTIEDGILTASEISNLDLSACQLVVLSACETGLGEIKGSEGVFGLQRAFKMAGVKNIIMSLWKVPDAQTAELFDIFYSECFAGKSIHEAFRSAQAKMKVKYSPYYWAGFVLLE